MRLQIDIPASRMGVSDPITAEASTALAQRVAALLQGAGLTVTIGSDRADVGPGDADWDVLSREEQDAGGFDYPEVAVDGPAEIVVDVFKRSAFFASEPGYGAEQEATSQVVRALRALTPVMPLDADRWADIEKAAAVVAVDRDGRISRTVLSSSELTDHAIALFDTVSSPEHDRGAAARFSERIAALDEHVAHLPPFHAAVATTPEGTAFGLTLPWKPPFDRVNFLPFTEALGGIVKDAIANADPRVGIPTGVELEHDESGTRGRVVYDTLVDSGAHDADLLAEADREAPFAWESIVEAAARREPRYQPAWLQAAVALLARGGQDITIEN